MIGPQTTCVTFDVDDTLYLERDYVRSGFRALEPWARDALGIVGFADRAWAVFNEGTRGRIFDEVLEGYGIEATADLVADMVEVYRSHRPLVEPVDDAGRCVAALLGHVHLAVISDGPLASQRAKVAALGISDWAEVVILTEELGAGFGKPHRRAFELVEERTGCRGSSCVYVADNPVKDFIAPRALGWTTIRIRRPAGLWAATRSGDDVQLELADLVSLPALIGVESHRVP